jgi:hypothetical protein
MPADGFLSPPYWKSMIRTAVSLLVLGTAIASLSGCASPSPAYHAEPSALQDAHAGFSGLWAFTVSRPDGMELDVIMTVEPAREGGWAAYSRPGALGELLSWRQRTLARISGRMPARGAVVRIENGTAWMQGDSLIVEGAFASPFLGEHQLIGAVVGGRLRAELRREGVGSPTGSIMATPHPGGQPVRDYRALAANVRSAFEQNLYDPALLHRPEWRRFLRGIDTRFATARDDADAMVAFYALQPSLNISHVELFRNPDIDEDLSRFAAAGTPDELVTLTFPAPGVARLRVTRWNAVTPAVTRAFERIAEAQPHTLILDVRGNPGGDVTSMAPASHLVLDSTIVGVFLGRKWYAEHRTPPTLEVLRSLPVIADESAVSVIHGVREHGALVGVLPPRQPYFGGDVFLLIDGGSGSASEPLAHLLKASGRATLIGETTAGAMLSGPPHMVGDGWILVLPVADYYTAEGVRIEGSGVTPHVRVASADALVAAAERIGQQHPLDGLLVAGLAHQEARRWSEAEGAFREALRLAPGSVPALHGLGRASQELQRWEAAFEAYEAVVAENREDMSALYQVGRTAALSGQRLDRGEEAFRAYLLHTPGPGQPPVAAAYWRLGTILSARGATAEARRAFEEAVRLDPANTDYRSALQQLAQQP